MSQAKSASKQPPRLGRDEMNLADFAIGLATNHPRPDDPLCIERSQLLPTPEGNLHQKWTITGSPKYGLPRPCDDDLLLGLLYLASEQHFASPSVCFTRYSLIKLMGWSNHSKSYERIENGLRRLKAVTIEAQSAFYDGETKQYVSRSFGILDEYQIAEKLAKNGNCIGSNCYARFSEVLWTSIQCENIKRLDLALYYALRSPVARRLLRFLDKRRWKRSSFEVDLFSLAEMNVGLDLGTRPYPSQIKQALDRGHGELQEHGFLKGWDYTTGRNGRDRVRYLFGKADRKTIEEEVDQVGPSLMLVQALTKRSVSQGVAQELVREFADRIPRLVTFYDHLLSIRSSMIQRNPVGWLIRAIQEDYTVSSQFPGYIDPEEKARAVAQKEQQRHLELLRQEEETRAHAQRMSRLDGLPAEEYARVVAAVRHTNAWMRKLDDDHPALRAAVLEHVEASDQTPGKQVDVA